MIKEVEANSSVNAFKFSDVLFDEALDQIGNAGFCLCGPMCSA